MTVFMRPACWVAVTALILAATHAHAASLVYEGFDDTSPGVPLLGSSGGSGFASPWSPGGFNASIFTNYTVASGSLSFAGLQTSGNHVTTSAQNAISGLTRNLTTPLGTPGTTVYLSVLFRPEGVVGQGAFGGFFGLYLNASTTTPVLSQDLFLGKPGISNLYDIEDRGGINRQFSGVTATAGRTDLLVLRMDFTSGIDRFTLYVNPNVDGPEPTIGTVKQDSNVGIIPAVTLYSTGAYSIDEIRIGTTYADVVAVVPEPHGWVMAGTAALVGLGCCLRRHAASSSSSSSRQTSGRGSTPTVAVIKGTPPPTGFVPQGASTTDAEHGHDER